MTDLAIQRKFGDHGVIEAGSVTDRRKLIDRIPTVENLAQVAFGILKAAYTDRFGTGLHLHKLVLHETPNCWAEITDA